MPPRKQAANKNIAVYNSVLPTFTDGESGALQFDVNGQLLVSGGSSGGGTQYTDGAVVPTHPVGNVTVFDNGGTFVDVSATNPLPVSATNLGKQEDSAHTNGDTGVAMWGVRNDAETTFSNADGDYSIIATDGAGRTKIYNERYTYAHISTSTTTTVRSGATFLHAISINTKGTVASTVTVYESTTGSGNVVGVLDSLNLSGLFIMDVELPLGLTIVTTGTVAPDITVSYSAYK